MPYRLRRAGIVLHNMDDDEEEEEEAHSRVEALQSNDLRRQVSATAIGIIAIGRKILGLDANENKDQIAELKAQQAEAEAKRARITSAWEPHPAGLRRVEGTGSNKFLRFFFALPKAEANEGFLNFDQAWWGRGQVNLPLLVRDCYAFFYDTLVAAYASRNPLNMVVTGTPGVGKSAFGLYAVWRLVTELKCSVLYEVKSGPVVLFATKPMKQLGGIAPGIYAVEFLQKEMTLYELCNNDELVRIQDPIDNAPIQVLGSCFNLVVLSSDEVRLRALSKDEAGMDKFYMDL